MDLFWRNSSCTINDFALTNGMIPARGLAQAGFLPILILVAVLASLIVVPNFLDFGPYSVFPSYFHFLLPGIRSGAAAGE
jgi:hypothetical protein